MRMRSLIRLHHAPHRDQSGHITCSFDRAYHVLTTCGIHPIAKGRSVALACFEAARVVGADHVITFGTHSLALPPLPSLRGYAGHSVELSHRLDGRLLVSYRKVLLLSLPLPLLEHADRRPAPRTIRQKTKTPMPRIYNLGGRPALAAVT
jgi:hypothetical protein